MLIKIGEFECTECWDGVFYKKLANYTVITECLIMLPLNNLIHQIDIPRALEIRLNPLILGAFLYLQIRAG